MNIKIRAIAALSASYSAPSQASSSQTFSSQISSQMSSVQQSSAVVQSSTMSIVSSEASSVVSSSGGGVSSTSGQIPAAWLDEHPKGVAQSLPSLRINTQNAAPIETKETYLQATFELQNGDAVITGNTEIRGRGNSTWNWVKKPYRLRLGF